MRWEWVRQRSKPHPVYWMNQQGGKGSLSGNKLSLSEYNRAVRSDSAMSADQSFLGISSEAITLPTDHILGLLHPQRQQTTLWDPCSVGAASVPTPRVKALVSILPRSQVFQKDHICSLSCSYDNVQLNLLILCGKRSIVHKTEYRASIAINRYLQQLV